MLSVRAGVRAHVAAHSAIRRPRGPMSRRPSPTCRRRRRCWRRWAACRARASRRFARGIAPALGASPGAVILRTDESASAGTSRRPSAARAYTPEFYAAPTTHDRQRPRLLRPAARGAGRHLHRPGPARRAEALAPRCGRPVRAPGWTRRSRCWRPAWPAARATLGRHGGVLHDQCAGGPATSPGPGRTQAPKDAAARLAWRTLRVRCASRIR
jgi:hypothetical protein